MAYTINRHLANLLTSTGSLANGKIPADYITNAHIADNTIATSQLHSSFTIGAGHIPANTVTISHLAVTDGSAGQVLKTDGSGNLSFTTISADKITEGNTFVEAIDTGSNGQILFVTENTQRWQISSSGHLLPISNAAFDIGSASNKVRDLYVDDNSIHIGTDTKLSVDAAGEFNITDNAGVPKKIKVDEIEIGSGDDRVILKRGASGDLEQQRKLSGVKQTATKPYIIGVNNSGDITEGGSNKFYTDARVQAYLTGQGIVNQTSVIAAITDSAPAALDTLNELAAAIGDDANFSTTITNSIATKLPLAGGTLTGNLTVQGAVLTVGNSSSGNIIVKRPNANYIAADQSGGYFIFITNGRATSYANRALSLTTDNDAQVGRDLNAVRNIYAGGNLSTAGEISGTLAHGTSGARSETNGWHYDTGNQSRFYFEAAGRTFYRSNNGHQFRTGTDATDFNISNDGHIHIASNGDSQASSTEYIKAGGVAVLTSSRVLQNVSGNVSMFTNDAGYTTNVGDVTAVGAVAGTPISVADGGGPVPKIGWYTTLINTSTNNADGDYFLVHNGTENSGSSHRLLKANINISGFNNDAGYTSFDGNYNSLSNRPTIPTNNNQLTNGASYITSSALSPYLTSSTAASTYATPADITAAVNGLVNGAPGALNTLDELALALGDDANFATTITNSIGGKLSVTGGTLTGKLIISNANYNNHLELTRTGQGTIGLTPSGNQILVQGGTGFSPSSSNGQDLGRSDKYWRDIYFGNSIKANGTTVIDSNRNTTFNNSNAISFLSTNGYWVGGTRRIDGSGNLENIGTINSGAITSTGAMQLYVGSDAVTTDNTGLTFTLTGTYSDGRYEHRFRKRDEGGGIPLYIDKTESTANSHTAIARFGSYTSNPDQFEVYGGMRAASGAIIGKLAVKSSAVHASYDFYNNGTSYFNGSVVVDDALSITGASAKLNIGGQQVLSSARNMTNVTGNISMFTNDSGYITSADGGNAATLDGLDSTRFIYGTGTTGTTVHTISNWNSPTKSGWYSDDAASNKWSTANWSSIMHVKLYNSNNNYASQLGFDTYNNNIYARTNNNGTFTSWDKIWHAGVDGSGSGLDADLLDGVQGASYLRSDATDTASGPITFTDVVTIDHNTSNMLLLRPTNASPWVINIQRDDLAASRVFTNNYSSQGVGWVFEHTPYDYNVGSPGKFWSAANDGAGSGLDADLLDGKHASDFVEHEDGTRTNAANLNSYLTSGFYNTGAATIANKPSGASDYAQLIVAKGIDTGLQIYGGYNNPTLYVRGWHQSGTFFGWRKLWNDSNDGSGSGLDADLLDGQQGSYYLDYNNLSNKPSISGVTTGSNNVFTVTQFFRKNDVTNYTNSQLITESYGGSSTLAGIGFHISGSVGRHLFMNNSGDLFWNSTAAKIWRQDNDGSGSGLDADNLDGVTWATQTKGVGARQLTIEAGNGQGIGFWGGTSGLSGSYAIAMSAHNGSDAGRHSLDSTSDYNMYFKMSAGTDRGFTFKNGSSNVAAITSGGRFLGSAVYLDGSSSQNQYVAADSTHSLTIRNMGATGAGGLVLQGSSGTHGLQMYWDSDGAYYGFLDAAWANWDIQKARNGAFKVDEGSGLQRVWNAGNDGSGSGLDADLLDGQQGSYYFQQSTPNQEEAYHLDIRDSRAAMVTPDGEDDKRISAHFTNQIPGYSDWRSAITLKGWSDGYYAWQIHGPSSTGNTNSGLFYRDGKGSTWGSSYEIWHAGRDGSGSGLDADTLDGQHASAFQAAGSYLTGNQTITLSGAVTGSGTTSISTANPYQTSVVFSTNGPDSVMEYQQQASITDTKLAPTGDWHNSIRMGHGDPYSYYSNTIALQMTGGLTGTLRTQTISNNNAQGWRTVWDTGNDGAGSGLDSDLLDGQQGSYYLDYNNFTNKPTIPTNNNQLTNGAGYTTNTGTLTATNDRIYISDTRNANRLPSFYDDRYVQADFNQSVYFGISGGDAWGTALTVSKWASWDASHRQEQLIFAGTKRAFRVATSDSAWSSAYTIWDSSTDGSGSGLDADTVDGLNSASFLRSDATDTATGSVSLRGGGAHLGNHEFATTSTATGYSIAAIELRESNYGSASATPPILGFHWGGVVASTISMDSGGAITIRNNPGNGYENLRANNIYAQGTNLVWHTGNDGPGTGLDADTVDGQHASAFLTDGSIYLRSNTGDTIDNNVVITQRGEFTTGTSGQNNSRQAGTLSYSYGYQFGGAWSSPFPDLVMGYHTGMRLGGYYGYGGTRFYPDHPSRTTTVIFSVGNGDSHVRATNNIYAYTSDKRLKENFRPIENAVDKVKAIGGFIFDWRKDMMDKHEFNPDQEKDDAGLIAQEVEKVLPAAIKRAPFDYDLTKPNQSKSGEDFLTVQYEKVVPLLVEAIKEQQKQIDELKKLLENK